MTKIKHEAMVGTGEDMCNLPENIDYNHHIMAYRKDVTGEILGTVPSQPNLLITHKNSMYMSGYWSSSSSVLSWRLLNKGDGTDILTTTTTTTTTPPPARTKYIVTGSFSQYIYYPTMTLTRSNGVPIVIDGSDIVVEYEGPTSNGFDIIGYQAFVITSYIDISGCTLRVSGKTSALLISQTIAGQLQLPRILQWGVDSDRNFITSVAFTSLILTTTTTTTTTTTQAPATPRYRYQATIIASVSLDTLLGSASNANGGTCTIIAERTADRNWKLAWNSPSIATTGWSLNLNGPATETSYSAFVSSASLGTFTYDPILRIYKTQSAVPVTFRSSSIIDPSFDPFNPSLAPAPIDDTGDTNSLDEAINDYLNE
jgi:hypothetical protein